MGYSRLLVESSERVAWIRLNRPAVLNALDVGMRDELSEVLDFLELSASVDVVVIAGEGRAFCAGADLSEFGTAPSPVLAREIRARRDNWDRLRRLPQVVIVGAHGYCLGSGLEILCLADLRIAEEGTIFGFPEMELGMIPAAGGTQTLPRELRRNIAADLILSGRRFDAAEAFQRGLLSAVVGHGKLPSALAALESRVLAHPSARIRAHKRLVANALDVPAAVARTAEGAAPAI